MTHLDTQSLVAFIAVADHLSFSRAAEQLHLTQPAVSKRIAQLESQLGAPLFDRIRKQVMLTEAGATLLPHARDVVYGLHKAQKAIDDLGGRVTGRLAIAFSHHIGLHRLPPVLKRFAGEFPDVSFDIRFVDSEQAYELVGRGEIDIAAITLAPEPVDGIIGTHIWRDPLAFVCSPEHALHLQDRVSLEQLAELEAILPGDNTYTGRIITEAFAARDLDILCSMRTNYLETIKMIVSVGLGWSVLPRTMTDSLEVIDVEDIYLERRLGLIQLDERQLSNAATAFKAMLVADSR